MTSRSERDKAWGRGFLWGFGLALFLVICFVYGQRATADGAAKKTPPKYWIETALKIGQCEQPSGRAGKWASINWKNETNHSFKGGLGMTNVLWDQFKRKGQPEDAHLATPMEQIWASWRFYLWANSEYPGAGHTGWECSKIIGFRGFTENGEWK